MNDSNFLKNNRLAWLDNVKAFAILVLFWGHCCGFACGEDICNFVVSWHMYLFVFVSGYTALSLKERINCWRDVDCYIQKMAKRIGIPNLVYTVLSMQTVYFCQGRITRGLIMTIGLSFILGISYMLYRDVLRSNLCKMVLYGIVVISFVTTPIWFLPFLMLTMITFVVTQCIIKQYGGGNKFLFNMLFLAVMYVLPSSFHATAEFALIFLIAMYLNKYSANLIVMYQRTNMKSRTLTLVLLGGIAYYCYKKYNVGASDFYWSWWYSLIQRGDFLTFPLRQVSSVIFVLLIVYATVRFSGEYNRFSKIGALTIALYPLNCIIVGISDNLFHPDHLYGENPEQWWIPCLNLFVNVTLSFLMVKYLEKNKFTRFSFLGLSK